MSSRQPVLSVLATMFIVSAAIRLLDSGGEVWAANEILPAGAAEVCVAETPDILAALDQRAFDLDTYETSLAEQAKALEERSKEIDGQIAELERTKAELEATVVMVDSASENDLMKLTSVYENMKPSDAAELFSLMDPAFAAGFIGRMQPEVSAQILTNIDPEVAYTLSVVLAGRNANAGQR